MKFAGDKQMISSQVLMAGGLGVLIFSFVYMILQLVSFGVTSIGDTLFLFLAGVLNAGPIFILWSLLIGLPILVSNKRKPWSNLRFLVVSTLVCFIITSILAVAIITLVSPHALGGRINILVFLLYGGGIGALGGFGLVYATNKSLNTGVSDVGAV